MSGRAPAAALLVLLLAAAPPAAAQLRADLSAGSGLSRAGMMTGSRAGAVLAPSVALDGARGALAVQGRFAWLAETGDWSADLAADGAWRPAPGGALRPDLGGELRAVSLPGGERGARALGRARLHAERGPVAAWLGAGAGAAWRDSASARPVAAALAGVALRLGAGSLRVESGTTWFEETFVAVSTRVVPIPGTDTMRVEQVQTDAQRWRSYTDARLAYRWAGGRVALDAGMGLRLPHQGAPAPELWGDAGATVALSRRASLAASYGVAPGLPELGMTRARVATLALRLHPGRAAPPPALPPSSAIPGAGDDEETALPFLARPAGEGTWELVLRPGPASTVEVQGDFTDWRPVPMEPRGDGAWSVRLPLVAGTHRLNVRIDGGEWTAPAGLPAVADDFGGSVGLLVVDGSSG